MSQPVDHYGNFRYRIKVNDRYVAGFSEISSFPQRPEAEGHRRSGYPPHALGPEGQGSSFISLERGVTFDRGFGQWVSMVRCYGPATGKGSLLPEYKRPCTIEAYDADGKVEYAYHLSCCWIAEYKATPAPDTGANEITIHHMKIGFESWVREPEED